VIERTPALRWLDLLGRRPAGPAPRITIPAPSRDPMEPAGAGTTGRSGDPPPPGQ